MPSGLSPEDKTFIREYVADACTDEEKTVRREECARDFGVSISVVRAITAWTKIYAERTNRSLQTMSQKQQENILVIEPAKKGVSSINESKIDVTDDNIITGVHLDYDNETKNEWRKKWKEYLEKQTNPDGRKNMKVLCLPGKKCLEIPLYLELGFLPQNIVGIEGGDKEAREEFVSNAKLLGINGKIGRLEKIMPSDDTEYDVISLDFHGPVTGQVIDICQNIIPAKRAVMMTNLLSRREGLGIQSELFWISEYMNGNVDKSADKIEKQFYREKNLVRGKGIPLDLLVELNKKITGAFKGKKPSNLPELRDNLVYTATIGAIGQAKLHHWMIKNDFTRELLLPAYRNENAIRNFRGIIGESFAPTIARCFSQTFSLINIQDPPCDLNPIRIGEFIIDTLVARTHIADLKMFEYQSESKGGSPFYSDFAVIETPIDSYVSAKRTVDFFRQIALCILPIATELIEGKSDFGFAIRTKQGNLAVPNSLVTRSDQLILILNGSTIASIKMGHFLDDLALHQKIKKPYKLYKEEMKLLERAPLE